MSFRAELDDALTYESFFGLTEKAFSLIADARFVYESPTFAATRDGLLAGIRRREGLLVLTGEIGTGKTTLCRAVLRDLRRKTYSSLVPDPFASREDLLKMLLIDFGALSIDQLTTGSLQQASRTELSYLLGTFLESLTADAHVVVIIDEAQNLTMPLIEETRILADTFGADGRLQIVYVGQPELHAKLKLPEMRQVDQRVCGYHRLPPMSRDAVAGYVRHRLDAAGGEREREFFPADVIDALHRRSGGVPRLINRVCDRALHLAFERRAHAVNREILDAAMIEVGAVTLSPTWDSIVFADAATQPLASVARAVEAIPSAPELVAAPVETAAPLQETIASAAKAAMAMPDDFFADKPADDFKAEIENWLATELAPATAPRLEQRRAAAVPPQLPERHVRTTWPPDVRPEIYIRKLMRMWTKRAGIALGLLLAGVVATTAFSSLAASLTATAALPAAAAPFQAIESLAAPQEAPAEAPLPAAMPAPVAAAAIAPVAEAPLPVTTAAEYLVAVGVFANREHADQLVDTLTAAGLPAMQRSLQRGARELSQIVLGPFLSHADADDGLQRLRALGGFDDALVISDTATFGR